jgi:hypothetical protein
MRDFSFYGLLLGCALGIGAVGGFRTASGGGLNVWLIYHVFGVAREGYLSAEFSPVRSAKYVSIKYIASDLDIRVAIPNTLYSVIVNSAFHDWCSLFWPDHCCYQAHIIAEQPRA